MPVRQTRRWKISTGHHPKWLAEAKAHLGASFKTKDFEPVKTYLSIEFKLVKNQTVFMSQEKYTDNILRKFGMEDCKQAITQVEAMSALKRPEKPDNE